MATLKAPEPADLTELLPTALLLAATGGLLDAVTYLNHGHVFANAMTGNTIFLGISVLTRDWRDALHHIVPLAAFFAGVLTSKFMRSWLGFAARPAGIILEMATLVAMGLLSRDFPQMVFVGIVAFVASLQFQRHREVGGQ